MEVSSSYITQYSSINPEKVTLNGVTVLKKNNAMDDFLSEAYRYFQCSYPKFHKMDKLAQLGFMGVEILPGINQLNEAYGKENVGVILANTNSSLNADRTYFKTTKTIPSPAQFVYTLPNIVIGEISIRHQFKGENAFFLSEKPDTEMLHFYINDLLQRNRINACVAGWVEYVDDSNFEAILFMVENKKTQHSKEFTILNLNKLYA